MGSRLDQQLILVYSCAVPNDPCVEVDVVGKLTILNIGRHVQIIDISVKTSRALRRVNNLDLLEDLQEHLSVGDSVRFFLGEFASDEEAFLM